MKRSPASILLVVATIGAIALPRSVFAQDPVRSALFLSICRSVLADPPPAVSPTANAPLPYHIERRPAQRVEAKVFLSVTPGIRINEWLPVAAALPELPRQQKVKTQMLVPGHDNEVQSFVDETALKRPYLFADIKETKGQFTLTLVYTATLMETALMRGRPARPVAPLSAEQRKTYTSATTSLNYQEQAFKDWKQQNGLSRRQRENDLDYAFRVFWFITQNAKYAKEYGEFSATQVCSRSPLQAACGGLSALFAACIRSENIPARLLFGRYALPAPAEESNTRFLGQMIHVKSEFWLDGIGWIPIEIPDALGCSSVEESYKYFGYDKGSFITLHEDDDLKIVLGRYGLRTAFAGQVPMIWTNPSGNWAGQTKEDWLVKNLPITSAP